MSRSWTIIRSEGASVELRDRSGAFLDALGRRLRTVAARVGRRAVARARELAPVSDEVRTVYRGGRLQGDDAKHLRDTIRYRIYGRRGEDVVLRVGAGKFTAHFVELGTEFQPPRPFLRPGLRDAAQGVDRELVREIARLDREVSG